MYTKTRSKIKQFSALRKTAFSLAIATATLTAQTGHTIEPSAVEPNDKNFWQQAHLENLNNIDIDIMTAWSMLQNEPKQEVIVAIIDTAMDTQHFDIKNNLWVNTGEIPGNGIDDDNNGLIDDVHGYDFRNNEGSTFDGIIPHATPSAGIIAAETNNELSAAAVTGGFPIKLMTLQMINIDEAIAGPGQAADAPFKALIRNGTLVAQSIVDSMEYAVTNGADIISMSLVMGKDPEILRMDDGETAEQVAAYYMTATPVWYALPDDAEAKKKKPSYVSIIEVMQEDNPNASATEIEALVAAYCQMSFDRYYAFLAVSEQILATARDNNVLVVIAGLNATEAVEDYPGLPAVSNENVIKIGGSTYDGGPASGPGWFSEHGKTIRIYAPGQNLVSTMPSNDLVWIATNTGTSFATPIVSGIAAIIRSVKPNITYQEMIAALEAGVEETPEFLFTLEDGSTHQAGMIRAPLVLQNLGYSLPQGTDSNGVANAPIAIYSSECGAYCNGPSPITVTFDASASVDLQGTGLSYEWNFDDGTTAVGPIVTHTFDAPLGASYKPFVTVTDQDGYTDKSKTYRVKAYANGIDYVDIRFKGANPYRIEGTILTGDLDIRTTWYAGRFLTGTGTVEDENGDVVTITYVTSQSGFGLVTGSVTAETVNGTYFASYSYLPVDYNSANSTLYGDANAVEWTVVDGI